MLRQRVTIKKDEQGNTPIDLAISSGDNNLKRIFSDYGYVKK
jgi:hypothetical protein